MDLIAIIVVFGASARAGLELWRSRAILAEFGVSRALPVTVALYPLGILGIVVLPFLVGIALSFALAVATLVPGVLLARRAGKTLQRGDGSNSGAQNAASTLVACGVGAVLYAVLVYAMALRRATPASPCMDSQERFAGSC